MYLEKKRKEKEIRDKELLDQQKREKSKQKEMERQLAAKVSHVQFVKKDRLWPFKQGNVIDWASIPKKNSNRFVTD